MRILHVYPAIAAVCDAPRVRPESVTLAGIPLLVYRRTNVYMDSKTLVTRYEAYGQDTYFLEVCPEVWVRIGCAPSDEVMESRLITPVEFGPQHGKRPIDGIPDFIRENAAIANDTAAYTTAAAERISARKAQRENEEAARKLEREKREQEQQKEYMAAVTRSLGTFADGGLIPFDHFEFLCTEFGVTIPLRTLGACRKNVSEIGLGKIRVSNGSKPDSIFRVTNQLLQAIIGKQQKPDLCTR